MNLDYVKCNLCGHDNAERLFEQRDSLTGCATQFPVVKCKDCGLVYVNPRPSVDDMHAFYPKDFVSYQFELFHSKQLSLRERLLSFVTKSTAVHRVDLVRRLLAPDPNLNVLDLGCGRASFLYYLREELKCRVTGMDFDESSVKYCREMLNINAVRGDMSDLQRSEETYDLITMWHFLEHEFDPLSTLFTINNKLRGGQFLILEVPNSESLENILFKKRSYLYDVPRHLYSFSPTTIAMLLAKAGFQVEKITFPHFAGGWMGTAQSILFGGKVYKDLKQNIFLFVILSQILFPIEYLVSKTRWGSIMTVVAKKAMHQPR